MFVLIQHTDDKEISLCGIFENVVDARIEMHDEWEEALDDTVTNFLPYDGAEEDLRLNSECGDWHAWLGCSENELQSEWVILDRAHNTYQHMKI